MTQENALLIEIGTEELPPNELNALSNAFSENIVSQLQKAETLKSNPSFQAFATPRRLSLKIENVLMQSQEKQFQKLGPNKKIAFDQEGKPTQAALGFAKSCNTTFDQIKVENDRLCFTETQPGQKLVDLLPPLIEETLEKIPIKKRMHWGYHDFSFARPVRSVTIIYGNHTLDFSKKLIFHLTPSHQIFGHRFLSPCPIAVTNPDDYETSLQTAGKVIPNFDTRKKMIFEQAKKLAQAKQAQLAVTDIHDPLLDEMTALVEWPNVLMGEFNQDFLSAPKESLISSIKTHQKCIPLLDSNAELLPYFILVSNLETNAPEIIIEGNQKVMQARLKDAVFYFEQDQKIPLEKRVDGLKNVLFQQQLGTLYDKTKRIQKFCLEQANNFKTEQKLATQASLLCKTDLLTDMVGEFPELQGTMGYYYAKADKLPEAVCVALKEYYYPRFASDVLPSEGVSTLLALADKLDTLCGIFGIEKRPSGNKDPFSLRRQALGVMRILIEHQLPINLESLIQTSLSTYTQPFSNKKTALEVFNFCFDRLRHWYETQNFSKNHFEAVFALRPKVPYDFHLRLKAVQTFSQLPEAETLAELNKRVKNILEKNNFSSEEQINIQLLEKTQEQNLFKAIEAQEKTIKPIAEKGDYTAILKNLAALNTKVAEFFDHVMVMDENVALKNNRLNLLNRLRHLFLQVADVSFLLS